MVKYIVKRVLIGLLTLFILMTATFFLAKATPGSPFSGEKYKNEEIRQQMIEKYNLDKPVVEQYFIYVKNVVQGDFGESMKYVGESISDQITQGFPVTARLGAVAFLLAIFGGISLGIGAAISKRKWVNNVCMFIATIGASIPSFLIALLLIVFVGKELQMFPFVGLDTPAHYVLPAISLALYPLAMIAKLTRSSMLEVMRQDYIVLARSKGTPNKTVILKHALKNAMLPVVTYSGPMFAFLLTGSFVIENVFSIGGLGRTYVESIQNRDYTGIMGITIFLGFLIIMFNLITDLISASIDPRIKLK